MAIESLGNGGFAITGEDIEVYRLLSLRGALSIQVKTGLKSSRCRSADIIRNILAESGVKPARKLDKLLEQYEALLFKAGIMQS